SSYDLINIDRFNAYIKLMIDGTPSRPFNLGTIKPKSNPDRKRAEAIRQLSRLKYGRPRSEVVAEIYERSQLGDLPAAPSMPPPPSSP
ncbi:MAG: hypothetical protein HY459_03780, partial [Parcubacteria group bacterium]|nr:hypothetical protein [Parcubacteria group bacterium]